MKSWSENVGEAGVTYRFLEDIATADVAFEAWGNTREELFVACADALLATMVDEPGEIERQTTLEIKLDHEELDLLLYSFLAELVYFKDAKRLLLHADSVWIDHQNSTFHLMANVSGEEIAPSRHDLLVDVKAVTLHRLKVLREDNHWKATVVLDV